MTGIDLAGERVELFPERAAFWPRTATLWIADPHWGKASAFRAGGVPLPGGSTADDLQRLSGLIEKCAARRLVILGDLFHARTSKSPATLSAVRQWRERHADLPVTLIRGNHDKAAGDPAAELAFACVAEPWPDGPFAYRHYPEPTPDHYTLAGHLHPAAALTGVGRQRLVLPCFYFTGQVGVLPAFGGLTGTATVRPKSGDRVFVIAGDEVVGVSS